MVRIQEQNLFPLDCKADGRARGASFEDSGQKPDRVRFVAGGDGRAALLIGKLASLPCVVLPGEEIFDV